MAAAPFLRNRYWILRHGKSIPNEKGLIVSSIVCDYLISCFILRLLFGLLEYGVFLGSCLILICCGEFFRLFFWPKNGRAAKYVSEMTVFFSLHT